MTHVKAFTFDTFHSLAIRNFRLFFAGQLISQIGTWLTMTAQVLLVLHLTRSGFALGVLVACQFLPILFFGPWTGLIADRSDKRRLLLIAQSFAMLQSFALAAIALLDNPPVVGIYAIVLAGGFATAFDNPARRAFVVELVPESDVPNAVSMNSAMMTSSRIFGPALAGFLIVTSGYSWCFLLDGLSYVAVLWALWRIDPTEMRAAPVTPRAKGQVRAGLRYVRQVPELWACLVVMTIVGTLTFNFQVTFPLLIKRTLGGDDGAFTLFYSVMSVGSFLGALSTARRTSATFNDVARTSVVYGVAMGLLALVPNFGAALLAGALVGFFGIAFMTSCTALVQLRADPMMRGRVLALQAMVFLGSTPIGSPILGWICDALNARAGVMIGAVAAIGAGLWGLAVIRRAGEGSGLSVADRGIDDAMERLAGTPARQVLGEHLDRAAGSPVRAVGEVGRQPDPGVAVEGITGR